MVIEIDGCSVLGLSGPHASIDNASPATMKPTVPATAIARAPKSLAIWMAMTPTPAPAPTQPVVVPDGPVVINPKGKAPTFNAREDRFVPAAEDTDDHVMTAKVIAAFSWSASSPEAPAGRSSRTARGAFRSPGTAARGAGSCPSARTGGAAGSASGGEPCA